MTHNEMCIRACMIAIANMRNISNGVLMGDQNDRLNAQEITWDEVSEWLEVQLKQQEWLQRF